VRKNFSLSQCATELLQRSSFGAFVNYAKRTNTNSRQL
jgi:hypothetical protein